jgi:hypothetical protein
MLKLVHKMSADIVKFILTVCGTGPKDADVVV